MNRHNRHGLGNINLEIDEDNINYIDKNNEDIEKNKNDISSNLKINSNENDILYNLSEINYIKNNNSTQYLKMYIIFYFMIKKLKLILEIYFMKNYLMLTLIKMIL